MAGWSEGHLQEDGGQGNLSVNTGQATRLAWSSLLARTYSVYQKQFRTFFLTSLPPAFLAYICRFFQRFVIHGIRQQGWLPARHTSGYWMTFIVVALLEGAIYWVISGFFLAAIASNVLFTAAEGRPLITDAFSKARERLVAVVAVALLIWAAFVLSRGLTLFALFALLERLQLAQNYTLVTAAFGLVLLLLGGLFSRLGLAIPILIDDPKASVSEALRRSMRQSENWEPFFILFLAKCAVLGYAAYWLVNLGLINLSDRGMLRPEAYPWVQSLLYICIAAMLESPLFIAFTVLYNDSKTRRYDSLPVGPVN